MKDAKHDAPSEHLFVVFGGTGDLARRKLLPAVYRLTAEGAIGARQRVLAVARNAELDDASYRKWAHEALLEAGIGKEELDRWCGRCLHYQRLADDEKDYGALAKRIEKIEREAGLAGNRVFYLAVPPQAFRGVVDGLGGVGLHRSPGWTRLVVEKPFGEDLASARELNAAVHRWFDEQHVYRIDHYLGKETIQNLLVFRFANACFESLWNRDRIENVQITVAEDIGVGSRAGYYERSGALRDMVQNHLTQILTLVAMEVPAAYDAESVRHEKIKVLRCVRPIGREDVVFGQYGRGWIRGEEVRGYLEEPGVRPSSRTETFVALRIEIDSWRWQGVPFYLRTGKRLAKGVTQVAVTFRRPPVALFQSMEFIDLGHDVLTITLQPDEGFSLHVDVKRPGWPLSLEKVPLRFRYQEAFGQLADAYVTLLNDIVHGDQTLFVHADEVETAWELYEPLLDSNVRVQEYEAGTWGPYHADALLADGGHVWRTK